MASWIDELEAAATPGPKSDAPWWAELEQQTNARGRDSQQRPVDAPSWVHELEARASEDPSREMTLTRLPVTFEHSPDKPARQLMGNGVVWDDDKSGITWDDASAIQWDDAAGTTPETSRNGREGSFGDYARSIGASFDARAIRPIGGLMSGFGRLGELYGQALNNNDAYNRLEQGQAPEAALADIHRAPQWATSLRNTGEGIAAQAGAVDREAAADQLQEPQGLDWVNPARALPFIAQESVKNGAMLAEAMIGGAVFGPEAVAPIIGANTAGSGYAGARERGADPNTALASGLASGITGTATAAIPVGIATTPGASTLRRVGGSVVGAGLGGAAQEALNVGIESNVEGLPTPTLTDSAARVAKAGALSAPMGLLAAMHSPHAPTRGAATAEALLLNAKAGAHEAASRDAGAVTAAVVNRSADMPIDTATNSAEPAIARAERAPPVPSSKVLAENFGVRNSGPDYAQAARPVEQLAKQVLDEPAVERTEPAQLRPIAKPELVPTREVAAPRAPAQAEAPRAPLVDPQERATAEFEAKLSDYVGSRGVAPEEAAAIRDRFAPTIKLDPVTGLYGKEEFPHTLDTAKAIADKGTPVQYAEVDFTNLGGLNAHLGTSKADPHLRAVADILKDEATKAGAERVVLVRKGGDEFGAVFVGASAEQAETALASARGRALEYAKANGLDQIPHPKNGAPGIGLHYGVSTIEPGARLGDVLSVADTAVEARKKGAGYEQRGEARAIGSEGRPTRPAVASAGTEAARSAGADRGGQARAPAAPVAETRTERLAAPAEPSKTVPQSEPYGLTRVLYRGDVDAIRERLARVGEGLGHIKIEDGKPIGVYFGKERKAAIDLALGHEEPARPPLERAKVEETRSEVPSAKATTSDQAHEPEATGISHAKVAEERALKGKNEIEYDGKRTFGDAWDAAAKRVAADPQHGQDVAKSVLENPRALTGEESAALIQDRMRLHNEHRSASRAVADAVDSQDSTAEATARARLRTIEDALETNDEASKASGYEQGFGLAARRMMSRADYSLAELVTRGKVAAGRALTHGERSKFESLAKRIEEQDARIAELEKSRTSARANKLPASAREAANTEFAKLAAKLKAIREKDQLVKGCQE